MDFNMEAAKWDNERRSNRAKLISDEILKYIEVKDDCEAMEFGCGTGLISFNLKDEFRHITLIDTSEGMIDALNEKIENFKVGNMTALQADINNRLLTINKFDVIYTSMALHHITDVETVLKSLYNLMNNDGYLCVVELVEDDGSFHKLEKDFVGHNGFDQNKLKDTLSKIGFRDISTNIFYNDDKIIEDTKINYSLFLMVGRK